MSRCLSFYRWIFLLGLPVFGLISMSQKEEGPGQTGDTTHPLWSNWSKCFGQCSVKFQIRKCLDYCSHKSKLEIRECSAHQNCTAYKIRLSHVISFSAKVEINIFDSGVWKPFCNPAGIADKVCQIQGFSSSENASKCDMNPTPSHNNTTCGFLQRTFSINCSNMNNVAAVCKVNVSLAGSYSGIVQFSYNGTLKSISAHNWNINASQVVCRQIGFKGAIAPFSVNISQGTISKTCIRQINCSGTETSLSYCSFTLTTKCNPDTEAIASVTCDPKRALVSKFRKVKLAQYGEHIIQPCNLSPVFGVSHWYNLDGSVVTSDSSGNTRDHQTLLNLPNLTAANAGVYFCNNTKEYGSLIIYIEASTTTKQKKIKAYEKAIINCKVKGVPQPMILPTWIKNDRPSALLEKTKNNSLVITNATSDDQGNYSCDTLQVYEYQPKKKTFTFYVEVTGTYTSKQKENFNVYIATVQDEFVIGHGAILLCKILKTKASTTAAEWIREKDNKTLKTQIFYEKLSKDSKSEHFEFTLKISEVSDNDDGLYICRANSSIGSDQDSYFLNVTGGKNEPKTKDGNTAVIALSIVSSLLVLGIFMYFVCHRRRVSALRNVDRHQTVENYAFQSETDTRYLSVTPSCWEIARKQIDLQSVLGSGAFGEVWKAVVSGIKGFPGETTVAVKKLKCK